MRFLPQKNLHFKEQIYRRFARFCTFFFPLSFLIFLQILVPTTSQAGALHRLRFDHFSIDQGLPSTGVQTTYQTRDGFVWMGTSNGLARYDGRHVKLYSNLPGTTTTISHNRVLSLHEDERRQLWVGTRRGLNKIDLNTETVTQYPISHANSSKEPTIFAIARAASGNLWLATPDGAILFDPRSGIYTKLQASDAMSEGANGELSALLSDGTGGIWIGRGDRVAHIDQTGQLRLQFSVAEDLKLKRLSPTDRQVRSLAFDQSGRLWVGLTDGLAIWHIELDKATQMPLPRQLNLPRANVVAILKDAEGNMWLAMGKDLGLFRWYDQDQRLENFINLPSIDSSLSGNSLTSLMLDANGGLWIGTTDYGANLVDLNGHGFSTYLSIPGDDHSLSHRLVTALAPENNEYIWIGTLGGGVNRLHLPTGETQRIDRKIVDFTHIRALMFDEKKQLWIGGESLQVFDPKAMRSREVNLGGGLPFGGRFTSLAKDGEGNIWCGSSAGLYRISSAGKVTIFHADPLRKNSLSDDAVDSLLVDKKNRLWVGTKGGLHLWDASTASFPMIGSASPTIPTPEKLGVTSLRQDYRGRIWAATFLGLIEVRVLGSEKKQDEKLEKKDWELVAWSPIAQIQNADFESMQDAKNGEIWLSSERSLMRLRPDTKQGRNFPSLGRFDGAFNFAAAARGDDGSLFFGGVGLVQFQPELIADNSIAPRVVLSDILLFNKSLTKWDSTKGKERPASEQEKRSLSQPKIDFDLISVGISGALSSARQMQLNHQQSMVSYELAAMHFYNRTNNRYAWKLLGYDRDWIFGQADKSIATYTNLDPGTYHLHAKAANPDGVWSESTELITLIVAPPFWGTWWWYTLWTILVLVTLYFAYHRRVQGIHMNRLYLEEQVKNQTLEITDQKKLAELQREIAEHARNDIGRLSEIGLKITASLDFHAVLTTLYENVKTLIPCPAIGVGFVDWEKRIINFDYTLQYDQRILPYSRSLDALEQPATRCVLEAQEFIVTELQHDSRKLDAFTSRDTGEIDIKLENGSPTENSRSAVYVPLIVSGRVMGLIAILSPKLNAFGQNDLTILRTLATYTAVAYDNAEAYRRLQITQKKLVEQEKLAALGALVAGVSHELNTPIGNGLLVASSMQDASQKFLIHVQANQLRRSDLEKFCKDTLDASDLVVRNLSNAANLITSFKQIAVDQTSDQRRNFDLRNFCEEVALTLSNRIKREGHELRLDVESGLELDSYPGSIGQVLSNLIINAMVHGLQDRAHGVIRVSGKARGKDHILVIVEDNGSGIAKENIDRIFEPFFTTRLGKGGSGLGLHICYNIVNSVLGGHINVENGTEKGARFTIVFPRISPEKSVAMK